MELRCDTTSSTSSYDHDIELDDKRHQPQLGCCFCLGR